MRLVRQLKQLLCPPPVPKSRTADGQRILRQLIEEQLFSSNGWANPIDNIGAALSFARAHGIELAPGITHGSCRAYLPKERWKAQPSVHYIPLGDWIDRIDPCEAICLCALNCRELGIL